MHIPVIVDFDLDVADEAPPGISGGHFDSLSFVNIDMVLMNIVED
jgi:hypothetical protein